MENQVKVEDKIFLDIDPDNPVSEIESLCVNCEKNGTTRILFTKIPFFKEIIVMAFDCSHCGYRNTEVQPARSLADEGIRIEVKITSIKDLDRKIIKSEYASISIPECGLEIPPLTQKAKLTTIEGYITTAAADLQKAIDKGYYAELSEDIQNKIKETIQKLNDVISLKSLPVTLILDDPAGNSFIENPYAPHSDPNAKAQFYERSKEMLDQMGYGQNIEENKEHKHDKVKSSTKSNYYDKSKQFSIYKSSSDISAHLMDFTKSVENNTKLNEEALKFPTQCYVCYADGETNMCLISVPYFKELIISCFKCQSCGYKNSEVKGGGGISEKGTKYTLNVTKPADFRRDVFKSETASVIIPELEFETNAGGLGSMFTTVEGIIEKIIDNLNNIPFSQGDSSEDNKMSNFIEKLRLLIEEERKFTLILDDPISNSFIFSDNPEEDANLTKVEYERTFEQNEELGINDMKTENYGEDKEETVVEEAKK